MSEPKSKEKLPGDTTIWHQTVVSVEGKPFVQLILGTKIISQFTPEEAREYGHHILEAAESAEQDAFLFDWIVNKVGSKPQQAAGMLQDFRNYRLKRTGKRSGMEVLPNGVMGDGVPPQAPKRKGKE